MKARLRSAQISTENLNSAHGVDSFCGDSISFAHDDDARRQPFVAGLEGFQPPRDADRAGGHAVVDVDGREAR